ncbi:MAG: LptF/LptG family permease [bacterium]
MLKTLPKYIIREHIGPFFLALITIKLLFILNLLYRDLGKFLSKGVSLSVILEFLYLNLAWMIALSVPMAVLTATIMAFGRLSADNEVTAIKAGGIGLFQILPPVILLSAILAYFLIWFNNNVLPDFNHRARLLAMDIARKKPMINLEAGVIFTDIPNHNILVQAVEDRDSLSYVENIVINDESESQLIKTIIAEKGIVRFRQNTGMLEFMLFNGEVQEVNIKNPSTFKKLEFPKHVIKIAMSDIILKRSQSEYRGDREKSAEDLRKDIRENQKKIVEREQKILERVHNHFSKYNSPLNASQKLLKNVISKHQQLKQQIKIDLDMIKSYKKSSNIFAVELQKKYSIPVACIVFIFVGAPLGIVIRKSGWAAGAGLSIGFFLLYWACLIGGEILADRRFITPFWAMWSPNLIVGSAGVFLMLKTAFEYRWKWQLKFTSKLFYVKKPPAHATSQITS